MSKCFSHSILSILYFSNLPNCKSTEKEMDLSGNPILYMFGSLYSLVAFGALHVSLCFERMSVANSVEDIPDEDNFLSLL